MNAISKLLGVTGLASALAFGAAEAQTVLTLNSWLPPSHPQVAQLMVPFAEDVARVTEGRVQIQILPAPLGPPSAAFDLALNGVADITYSVQGYTPGRFRTAALAELPFLSDDAVVSSVAYWRVQDAMLAQAGEYAGVKVLSVFTHGPGEIFSSSPIESVDDIDGLKIRVGSTVAHDLATLLGAVPIEGPSSRAYELLSQGVADGIFFPFETVNFFNLQDLVSSAFTAPGGIYNTAMFMVMNQGAWDRLSAEDQAAIEPLLGESLARRAGEMWNAADAAGRAAMADSVTFHQATEADVAQLRARFAPVVAANLALVSETGVDGAAAYQMLQDEVAALEAGH